MARFHLGDMLSITTGRLVAPDHIDAVYKILNFMTGDSLYTHQIPRAINECRPYLIHQFAWLDAIDLSSLDPEHWQEWLAQQVEAYGEWHEVSPIPRDDHTVIDPLDELRRMRPDATIIPIIVPDEPDTV